MSKNEIQFPASNSQLQGVYDNAYDRLQMMLAMNDPARAEVERMHNAGIEMVTHLRGMVEIITRMLSKAQHQRDDVIDELNQIEKDLMRGESTHPLTQTWIDQMTEKVQGQIMARLAGSIAHNLEIGDFDAEIWLQILTNTHPTLQLSDQAKDWLMQLMIHIGQQGRASA